MPEPQPPVRAVADTGPAGFDAEQTCTGPGRRLFIHPPTEFSMNDERRTTHVPSDAPGPDTRHGPGPRLMGADMLIGNAVVNRDAEDLGKVTEIMLDVLGGRVSYAVLSFGGFLGMGNKLFAVPWAALRLDTTHKRFVLDVLKSRLETAPGFDPEHWPDMADVAWQRDIHAYYGLRPDGSLDRS